MTAYLIPATQQFFDNNGNPLAGGSIYTCIPGASGYTSAYLKDSYTDSTGTVTNPNPIVLDAFGRCNMWGDGTNYKLFIFNSSGALIRSDDNVSCILGVDPTITFQISDDSITAAKLADGSVTNIKLADGSVTAAKLADGSVTNIKLADGSVTNIKLADGSITTAKLVDNSITAAKLVDNSITTLKLGDGSVTFPKINPAVSAASSDVTTGTSTTQFITPYALAQAGITPSGGGGTADITSRIGSTGNTANRNMLDNTDFNICQRGTSISVATESYSMTLDRWYSANLGGASASTTSLDTMTINGVARGCLKFTSGNALATLPESIIYPARQSIEGYTLYPRVKAGDSVTISVWMEVSVAGKYAIALQNANNTYTYVHTVTLVANTPTEVVFTVAIPTTAGLWNCPNSNERGAAIVFGCISGATYQTASPDTWVSGSYLTTADCVNYAATAGATVKIARPRMEEGTALGSYESRSFEADFARCQYFLPAWSGNYQFLGIAWANNASSVWLGLPFTYPSRIAPTSISISAASHVSVSMIAATDFRFSSANTRGLTEVHIGGLSGLRAGQACYVCSNNASFALLATGAEL